MTRHFGLLPGSANVQDASARTATDKLLVPKLLVLKLLVPYLLVLKLLGPYLHETQHKPC